MPIYKMEGKKDGKQKYRVRINYLNSLGEAKQIDRVAYGHEEAKALEAKLLYDIKEEPPARSMTVKTLFEEYLSAKKHDLKESSLEYNKERLEKYVLPRLGGINLKKLDVRKLQAFKEEISELDLALRTKQTIYACLRAMLNYAVKGEIHALQWADIKDGYLSVTKSITQKLKGEDRITPPKNKSSVRTIQLPIPLINILNNHKDRCMTYDNFTDNCFVCGISKSLRDTTIQNRNDKYSKAAEVKTIRIHDFRHSHASLLANEGINIQEIARRLGHSKIEITWQTYSHMYPREEERAINILNKIV
ncbi:MAG: site-specific integrase [Oscillospiraceae bacterium]|nr:site-specific integrase [Oscillospiraceae bacterium]